MDLRISWGRIEGMTWWTPWPRGWLIYGPRLRALLDSYRR